jgi:hypothetical protein
MEQALRSIPLFPVRLGAAFTKNTAVWVHDDPVILLLTIDGEVVETTPEHPFYTEDGLWVPAGELEIGDLVYKADGEFGTVESVAVVCRLQPMYNLTVVRAHTFFVGDEQWLVHNDCDSAIARARDHIDDFQVSRKHLSGAKGGRKRVHLLLPKLLRASVATWISFD